MDVKRASDKTRALDQVLKRLEDNGDDRVDDAAIRDDRPKPTDASTVRPRRARTPADAGHGTPGGALGSLNETDVRDPEDTAEKSGGEA